MAESSFKWRGNKHLVLTKEPTYRFSATGLSIGLIYEGMHSECMAKRPAIGATIDGLGTACRVISADIDPIESQASRLTLTLTAPIGINLSVSADPLGDPAYELDHQELNQPIEQHPRCGILLPDRSPGANFGRLRTWEDWADLTVMDYYEKPGGFSLAQYKSLKAASIDSYTAGRPVINRTLLYFRPPSGVGDGLQSLQNPPVEAPIPAPPEYLAAWLWVLTGDRLSRIGRQIERKTQWTGYDDGSGLVAALLYSL